MSFRKMDHDKFNKYTLDDIVPCQPTHLEGVILFLEKRTILLLCENGFTVDPIADVDVTVKSPTISYQMARGIGKTKAMEEKLTEAIFQ